MDLERFVSAQRGIFDQAIAELRAGRKSSHWMWFVFPQIAGLGHSDNARHYAIRSRDHARAYLAHPVLGPRLLQAATTILDATGSAQGILGAIDAIKLRSSMTLFEAVADDGAGMPFARVLDEYFEGVRDAATLARLS